MVLLHLVVVDSESCVISHHSIQISASWWGKAIVDKGLVFPCLKQWSGTTDSLSKNGYVHGKLAYG